VTSRRVKIPAREAFNASLTGLNYHVDRASARGS
jgi:hypothetical protein